MKGSEKKRSKVQKGPKRNRRVKKDGGRLKFENKRPENVWGGPLKGSNA